MLHFYPAVIHKEPNSDYGVSFPDFPGCVTAGITHSEAMVLAKEALAFQIAGMVEDGDQLPEPTPWDELPKEKFSGDVQVLLTLIEAAVPGPSQRVNITIEQGLLGEIDAAAAALGTSRSAFLCESARAKLDKMLERRLEAAMRSDVRPIDALGRLAKEDKKLDLKESHPPDIGKIGVSDYELTKGKTKG